MERDEQIAALELKLVTVNEVVSAKNADLESAEHNMMSLKASLNEAMASCRKLEEAVNAVNVEKDSALQQVQDLQRSLDDYDQCLEDLTASASSLKRRIGHSQCKSRICRPSRTLYRRDGRCTQRTNLAYEATISELRVALSLAEAKCTELVDSTAQLTIERDAEIDHRDKNHLLMGREENQLKDSLASKEQIITECENSIGDLEKELKQEQLKSFQRDLEIEELKLEREKLNVDLEKSRQTLSAEIDDLKSASTCQ
ncbi:hypothetical protein MHU86_18223 [Fragilaria crotonensis]|nr:hypothetical protein MHU86_18223 [Fragilaria crotonensis]